MWVTSSQEDKMFFKFLLVSLLSSFAFADSFAITKNKDTYSMNNFNIYEDKNNSLDIDDFIKNRALFTEYDKPNLRVKKYPVWTYNTLLNSTQRNKEIVFSNSRAGIDFIDVYVYTNNKMIKHHKLGDWTPQEEREFIYRKSAFILELEPKQKYEIFTKYKSFGPIGVKWELFTQMSYMDYISQESLAYGFITGIILFIIFYVFFINNIFPSRAHKFYILYLLFFLLQQLSLGGFLYQFGVSPYVNTIILWSGTALAVVSSIAFTIYFFDLKKNLPKTRVLLLILSYAMLFLAFVYLFHPLKEELLYVLFYSVPLFLLNIVTVVYISFKMYLLKVKGSFYYLMGTLVLIIPASYFILGTFGVIKHEAHILQLSILLALVFKIFFIALAITEKIFQLKIEKENSLEILNEYSKLSFLGQTMIDVSHQYKEPINHIYYSINSIHAAKEFNDPNLFSIIDNSLKNIEDTTKYMASTGTNFLNFYGEERETEKVEIALVISYVISIIKNKFENLGINIEFRQREETSTKVDKYMLSNVLMVIFENAAKAFKAKEIPMPVLKIDIFHVNNTSSILISDNAGGIEEDSLDSIFEKDISHANSTGLGLFLAKSILNMKLSGDIYVKNIHGGAEFTIDIFSTVPRFS